MLPRLPHRLIRPARLAALTAGAALCTVAALTGGAQAAPLLCTQTVTGAHGGVLNVAAHQKLCLIGAVQDGAVNVAPLGALSVTGSTITGAVTLKGGFTTFDFCGSRTVRGAISATGASGAVLIGGSGLAGGLLCPANTIDGAVTLNANRGGVTLGHDHIGGAVTASANLDGTTISANTIGGRLTCSSNFPAPTDAGAANAVAGGRSGQTCAASTF